MKNDTFASAGKRPPLNLPFYYGWFVLAVCFLTTLTSAGVRSSPSVLIHPLEAEFGWSRAAIASAVSMNLLLFGIAAPISGWLLDRYGPRKVMLGSLLLLIVGVSGTVAMNQFWQFFLVWGVIVGLGAGGVGSVLTATVGNRWFVAKRGLALGILGSASSTGQLIFLPLFMAMITYAGWRMGSMTLIVVAIILLPLIYLFMRDDPSEVGLEPYGASQPGAAASGGVASLRGSRSTNASITLREVLGSSTFWLLAGSFFVYPSDPARDRPRHSTGDRRIVGGRHGRTEFCRHRAFRMDDGQSATEEMAGHGLFAAWIVVADFAVYARLQRVVGFCRNLRPGLVCNGSANDGDHCRHVWQAEYRKGLRLDFYVAPDRGRDYGFRRGGASDLDGRLPVCFSFRGRDRHDRRGIGAPDKTQAARSCFGASSSRGGGSVEPSASRLDEERIKPENRKFLLSSFPLSSFAPRLVLAF
jgi:hypothetical protein